MKRSRARSEDAIHFAKSQRRQANEFAWLVWQWIRNRQCLGCKFRREYPLPPYTVDFCCIEYKLVIEVDGVAHETLDGLRYDQRRDRFLTKQGFRILRIRGFEVVRDGRKVIERIERFVQEAKQANDGVAKPSPPERFGDSA